MLAGIIGISSPGQFAPGGLNQSTAHQQVIPAPFDRTFVVPQNGLPWSAEKTAQAITNFSFDWSQEIGSDLIAASSWLLESSDIQNKNASIDDSETIATILISGGVSGNIYNVTNIITTQSGLELGATFRLLIPAYNW